MVIYLVSIVVAVPLCVWELQKLEVRGSCTFGLYSLVYLRLGKRYPFLFYPKHPGLVSENHPM